MSRRSARQTSASVSLFPFLAVLICTMGALILVLIALSEHARKDAELAAAETAAGGVTDAERAEIDILKWRAEQWQATKAVTEQELADRRLTLSHIEDHTRRLRDEAAELARAAQHLGLAPSSGEGTPTFTADDLVRLQAEIAAAQAALEDRAHLPAKPASYAILPYQGASGTRRRPLYIECCADKLILQPDGIVLRESDFQGGLGPGNPLAVALRASASPASPSGRPGRRRTENRQRTTA
jgi:hypothetical protein